MGSQLGDVCGKVGSWHHTVNALRAGACICRSGHGGGLQFHFTCNKVKLERMLETARQVPCAGRLSLGTPLDMVSSSCPIRIECATTSTARIIVFSEVWGLHNVILFVLNGPEKISA